MKLIFCKSKWEMWHEPVDSFAKRAAGDGFDATELYIKSVREAPDEIVAVHREYGLGLLGQILTEGSNSAEHIASLEEQFAVALECQSFAINCHAGRDFFDFDANLTILSRAIELGKQGRIPVFVETHRGRPTYSATETRRYLQALPDLRLTADLSHWMVVHESDLSDQPANIEVAIRRSDHIHGRVGYEEGPQITDPGAPEWQRHVENHLRLWQRIVDHHVSVGSPQLTITPEFGPPLYMHTLPHTNMPVADAWDVNVFMKHLLSDRLLVKSADS